MRKNFTLVHAAKKCVTRRVALGLLSGLLAPVIFSTWPNLSAEAVVTNPQRQSFGHDESEPRTDIKPGLFTNPTGAEIGTVQDFVLDLQTGRIAYTVGIFDRLGKLQNRVFVLPWGIVKVELESQTFTLGEDYKTALTDVPSFSLETWPKLPAAQWLRTVTTYWQERLGSDFTAADIPESALYKAGDVVGMTVKNLAGEEVGKIAELMLDPDTGAIAYTVLSFDDAPKSDRTVFFALPWNVVRLNLEQHTLVADVDRKIFLEDREGASDRLGLDSSADTPQPADADLQA